MSVIPPLAATSLPADQQARTLQTAKQFEAMALGQLLAPIFDTVDTSKSLFGGGEGEATWRPMMVNEMAKTIASNGGLGLTQPVYQQMLRLQEGQAQRNKS